MYNILSLVFLLLLSTSSIAERREFVLNIDDWARPRSGEVIVAFQELRDLVSLWSVKQDTIEIRYPGGDQGSLWAGELKDWLIALGVPSNKIQLTSGNAAADRISLYIVADYD